MEKSSRNWNCRHSKSGRWKKRAVNVLGDGLNEIGVCCIGCGGFFVVYGGAVYECDVNANFEKKLLS